MKGNCISDFESSPMLQYHVRVDEDLCTRRDILQSGRSKIVAFKRLNS